MYLLLFTIIILLIVYYKSYEHFEPYPTYKSLVWEERFPDMVDHKYSYVDYPPYQGYDKDYIYNYAILRQLPVYLL